LEGPEISPAVKLFSCTGVRAGGHKEKGGHKGTRLHSHCFPPKITGALKKVGGSPEATPPQGEEFLPRGKGRFVPGSPNMWVLCVPQFGAIRGGGNIFGRGERVFTE